MPMNRDLYPANWEEIAKSVKDKAEWICEECGRPCRKPGVNWPDFLEYIKITPWHSEAGKRQRFTLTVSHCNHIPADCRSENLRALCSVCHIRYDAGHHAQARRANKRKAQEENGQMSLFN